MERDSVSEQLVIADIIICLSLVLLVVFLMVVDNIVVKGLSVLLTVVGIPSKC